MTTPNKPQDEKCEELAPLKQQICRLQKLDESSLKAAHVLAGPYYQGKYDAFERVLEMIADAENRRPSTPSPVTGAAKQGESHALTATEAPLSFEEWYLTGYKDRLFSSIKDDCKIAFHARDAELDSVKDFILQKNACKQWLGIKRDGELFKALGDLAKDSSLLRETVKSQEAEIAALKDDLSVVRKTRDHYRKHIMDDLPEGALTTTEVKISSQDTELASLRAEVGRKDEALDVAKQISNNIKRLDFHSLSLDRQISEFDALTKENPKT